MVFPCAPWSVTEKESAALVHSCQYHASPAKSRKWQSRHVLGIKGSVPSFDRR